MFFAKFSVLCKEKNEGQLVAVKLITFKGLIFFFRPQVVYFGGHNMCAIIFYFAADVTSCLMLNWFSLAKYVTSARLVSDTLTVR